MNVVYFKQACPHKEMILVLVNRMCRFIDVENQIIVSIIYNFQNIESFLHLRPA